MNTQTQNLDAYLANVPFSVPKGPTSLPEGMYLAQIIISRIQTFNNVKKLLNTYQAVWAEDTALHESLGGKITEFIDLEGQYMEIGFEKVNSLRIATQKQDSKSANEFQGEHVMICVKKNKKGYTNVSYVKAVPDHVLEAYNEYVAKYNAELEAKSKADGYDPEVGF